MLTSEYYFDLPEDLIAAHPAPERNASRLLVVNRKDQSISHHSFSEIEKFLHPEDLLVLNNSRVIPSRMFTSDQKFEVLLLEETSPRHWVALLKPGRKAQPGQRLIFHPHRVGATPEILEAEVLRTLPDGERVLRFFQPFELDDFGRLPIPPYIVKRREQLQEPITSPEDRERYQTVYAATPGSVAAPTAGLHFTPELLQKFNHTFVTLHVGMGTFRPVKTEKLEDHPMHEEAFSIPEGLETQAQQARRIVAVGTTSVRVLESVKSLEAQTGRTRIFIHPPYRFQRVGALLTNFHLPQSTLLMLVSAFAGKELLFRAYDEAIQKRYRFFSYGDAMLLV